MTILQAAILGLIQGLTEFLPISSSGHLLLAPALFGWKDPGPGFSAVIQIGTLFAVLIYFRRDLAGMAAAWFGGLRSREARKARDWRLAQGVLLGTLPIIIVGKLSEDAIETWFRDPRLTAAALVVFGIALYAADRLGVKKRDLEDVTVRDGVILGLWQCLALLPGVSRSGSTLTGGFLLGLERQAAARISFLLSAPAVLLSGGYKLVTERAQLLESGLAATLSGMIVAFISGYAAIAWLMKLLAKRGTFWFMAYRIGLGILILVLAFSGRIAAGS
jgi:undecaprenyl-diphosphatase